MRAKNPQIIATHRDEKFEDEVNNTMQTKQHRRFTSTPNVRHIREREFVIISEGGSHYLATVLDGNIVKVEIS